MKYTTRYVHKISTRSYDVGPDIELEPEDLQDRKTLAKALRDARMLRKGGQLSEYRCEAAKVVAFPANSIWHAIILTPIELRD